MKNKKGFMLAEIIIVSTIVMVGLVSLFTLVNKMFIQYDKRVVYDTVDATYVSRGLAENYSHDIIKSHFEDGDFSYLLYNKNNEYLKKNNVVRSYIAKYDVESLKNLLEEEDKKEGEERIETNFYEYIENFINSNDFSDSLEESEKKYNYIIFTEISDNCNENRECTEDNGNISFGHYKFNYKITEVDSLVEDNDPPLIYNVRFEPYVRPFGEKYDKKFDYRVTWDSYDANGSNIEEFTILLISKSGTIKKTDICTNGEDCFINYNYSTKNNNSITAGGEFYVKVYGKDEEENSGVDYCDLLTYSPYCGRSNNGILGKMYKKFTFDSPVNVEYSPNADYYEFGLLNSIIDFSVPDGYYFYDFTVNYANGEPSYTSYINKNNKVREDFKTGSDDLEIKMTVKAKESDTGCLAEGTKILLANGKYKNIEDITYNDLLTVIDYQNGGITYQYPNWLEKKLLSDNYIKITFSDNTIIKVVKDHAFFSYDDNEFITVSDKEKFHIGTKVAKLSNNKLDEVYVKNIEYINEEIYYHHVISTRYYNVIAEGIVTTDDVVFVTNLYGFNNNITWKNSPITDVYSHEEISVAPNYLFRGLRMYDGKLFTNVGMDKNMFINYILNNQLNEEIWDKPKLNKNGKRQWMVTTNDDIVTEKNKLSYLMEEGDYYTLKEPIKKDNKRFIGWYHTGEATLHQPGEKIEVLYGTHFIAKWDDSFERYNGSDKFEKVK